MRPTRAKHWSPEDWRAARKARVAAPLPQPDVDPALALLAATTPKAASLPGGLWGDTDRSEADRRRRRVDALLEARGIRPRGTW
jgi:hypothetical protein